MTGGQVLVKSMDTNLHQNHNKIGLPIVLIFYFALSLYFLFIKDFRYLIAPDCTSYISLAKKYLVGDFANAINGHWSPMGSWLMLPFLVMKIKPLLALELPALIGGGFTLAGINLLISIIGVRDSIRGIYILALVPLITLYATAGNPDLLSACFLIYYLYIILRNDFKTNKCRGSIAGLLGALAYLAKSYNFYFFLLHFCCFIMLFWYSSSDRTQRKIILINGLTGLLVFFLLSGIWISLLSNKYNTLTVSTAGNYNFSFTRPDSPGHMVDTDGLLAPPNKTALSAWEDPTYIKKPAWSPFESEKDFQYFIKKTFKNAATYLLYISRNHLIFFAIIYFVVLSIPWRLNCHNKSFYVFLTTVLHPLGYFLVYVEERYFWFDYILLYILSAFILDRILLKATFSNIQKITLSAIIVLYIAITPIIHLNNAESRVARSKEIYSLSKSIAEYKDFRNVKIASQTKKWDYDLFIAYYLKARYYGKVKTGISDSLLKKKLKTLGIQYYFVHGKLRNHIDNLSFKRKFGDLSIYKVVAPNDISN